MIIMRNWVFAFVACAALAVAGLSSAARPQSASITGPLDSVTHLPVAPAIGDYVLFDVVTDEVFTWTQVQCFQAGVLVFSEHHGNDPGSWGYLLPFALGPTYLWTSGVADCTAAVRTVRRGALDKTIASVEFTVSA